MAQWLLEHRVFVQLEQAASKATVPTAEQLAEMRAGRRSRGEETIMQLNGRTALIPVTGVLTAAPDWLSYFFGGGNTTYQDVIEAIERAEGDPNVDDIQLAIDSPGGEIAGLFEAMAAVQNAQKPVTAVGHNLVASAAFGIASQADDFMALNRATEIGSVGVAASFFVSDRWVDVISTGAPKKRPDVTTDDGKAIVQERLDALHDLFVEAIAAGRGVSSKTVNADFGQGAVVVADKALQAGMIDSIVHDVPSASGQARKPKTESSARGDVVEDQSMDLKTLKEKHPETYAAVRAEGVAAERDRTAAHLKLGQSSGAMAVALKAIAEGAEMTAAIQADYLAAHMNRGRQDQRNADDASAGAVDGVAPNGSGEPSDLDDQATAILMRRNKEE
jgi:ClpP class serine protease